MRGSLSIDLRRII